MHIYSLETVKKKHNYATLMVYLLSALVIFATLSEVPLRRSALMCIIRNAATNPATSASIVVVAAAIAVATAIDGDACGDGRSLLGAPPSLPVTIKK